VFLQEWPLTFFTILSQMAVGAFIILGLIQVSSRRRVGAVADKARAEAKAQALERVSDAALYAIGPLMVAGFIAAFFHLGNPMNGINVIRGVPSSPLAQEVMMGVGFAVQGFAFAATQWFHWGSSRLRFVLAIVTALWGLAFVWSMARLYMLPTIPHWDQWTTPAQLYVTTFLSGALAIGTALAWFPKLRDKPWLNKPMPANRRPADMSDTHVDYVNRLVQRSLQGIGVLSVLLLPVELFVIIFAYSRPDSVNPAAFAFPTGWFVLRLALLIIGAGLMGLFLARTKRDDINLLLTLVMTSYILVTISEVIGRFIFYGGMDRIGI